MFQQSGFCLLKARIDQESDIELGRIVVEHLDPHGLLRQFALFVPMIGFDGLLQTQSNQDTNDDDKDLVEKSSPAMEWFWNMDVHDDPGLQLSVELGGDSYRNFS
ncbi:MAG: hypothetical protein WCO83_11010 [Alphaproteobacteria bacterium]